MSTGPFMTWLIEDLRDNCISYAVISLLIYWTLKTSKGLQFIIFMATSLLVGKIVFFNTLFLRETLGLPLYYTLGVIAGAMIGLFLFICMIVIPDIIMSNRRVAAEAATAKNKETKV